MGETFKDSPSGDANKVGPDYFGYFMCEIKRLISERDACFPFGTDSDLKNSCGEVKDNKKVNNGDGNCSFFEHVVCAGFSDFKKERLRVLLKQTVSSLGPELDEMLDSVIAMCKLHSRVMGKQLALDFIAAAAKFENGVPIKKIKLDSSSSQTIKSGHANPSESQSDREKCCANCSSPDIPKWRIGSREKLLCDTCRIKSKSDSEFGTEEEANFRLLLESNRAMVEQSIMKHSDSLVAAVNCMEKQIEEILDSAVSTCRPMTLSERQQLQKLIKRLPPENLNRVVELVQRKKPVDAQQKDEIFVDLMKEDDLTLWRLYYYVRAFEVA